MAGFNVVIVNLSKVGIVEENILCPYRTFKMIFSSVIIADICRVSETATVQHESLMPDTDGKAFRLTFSE